MGKLLKGWDTDKKAPPGKFRVIGADCWKGLEIYHAGDANTLDAAIVIADDQDGDFGWAEVFDESGVSVYKTAQLKKRELAATTRK